MDHFAVFVPRELSRYVAGAVSSLPELPAPSVRPHRGGGITNFAACFIP